MKTWLILFGLVVLVLIAPFAYLSTRPSGELVVRTLGFDHPPDKEVSITMVSDSILNFYAPFYLKRIRGLKNWDERPPLAYVLAGCASDKPQNQKCLELADWAIGQGAKVDDRDSIPSFGFTALHESVFFCSLAATNFLLERNANPNIPATGVRYPNKTPLGVLQEMEKNLKRKELCPNSDQIAAALKAGGGHE